MSNKHFNIFTFKYLQQQKFVFIVPKQKKKRKRLKTKQILFFFKLGNTFIIFFSVKTISCLKQVKKSIYKLILAKVAANTAVVAFLSFKS